ncbi:MAG: phosphate acyltransferase PlsX [Verrucomicrobia bacterium]|nr:MAG: phosphate acyltransferase PlsX [Verrucomicrobiota bacterium]
MRIVVDVMGGDHGCEVDIEGVKAALHACDRVSELYLVGDEAQIRAAMTQAHLRDERVKIVHASEVLAMDDKPLDVLRKKKDCSMARAMELLKQGQGDAMISRGNTGGLMAAATIKLRPLENVERPAIAAVLPTPQKYFLLLDAGANAECKPLHLAQFAIMGSVYSREILGNDNPRVGVLSNGKEEMKGNDLTREALELCRQLDLNFLGYVEGHELFEGHVDVVITDGFVGNIVLKTCESMGKAIRVMLETELTRNPLRKNYGGAPLLGLNGTVIKAHGSARALAIKNAIRVGTETIHHSINRLITQEIARAKERLATAKNAVQTAAA